MKPVDSTLRNDFYTLLSPAFGLDLSPPDRGQSNRNLLLEYLSFCLNKLFTQGMARPAEKAELGFH